MRASRRESSHRAAEISHRDGQLLVYARTASDALGAVTDELGASARIVAVDKLIRGGIAGFFKREVVQVVAESGPEPGPGVGPAAGALPEVRVDDGQDGVATGRRSELRGDPRDPGGPRQGTPFADVLRETAWRAAMGGSPIAGVGSGLPAIEPGRRAGSGTVSGAVRRRRDPQMAGSPVAIALDRLANAAAAHENFGEALRAELHRTGWRPQDGNPARTRIRRVWTEASVAGQRSEAPARRIDGQAVQAPAGSSDRQPALEAEGDAVWSAETLRDLGLPEVVCNAVRACDSTDASARIAAIAAALQPLCSPLPGGRCAFVGPAAWTIASASVPIVSAADEFSEGGDVCIATDDSATGRRDLEWLRDGRWLHLVVGQGSWRRLLLEGPSAVSWIEEGDVPAAVSVAAEFSLILSSPAAHDGRRAAADPWEIARGIAARAERRVRDRARTEGVRT